MAQHDGANDAPKTERSADERRADHAAIDRLADELLPALVAKLGASGLGELDVREGAWRIRLRMPADGRASRRTGGSSRGGHQPPSPHTAPAPPTRSSSPVAEPDPGPPRRAVAASPAVGFYRPRPDMAAGARVRVGDPLGAVDVLGIPQDVVSPTDGIVGASLVEPGDPVEYGQEVVEIELLGASPISPAAPVAAATHPEAG